MTDLVAAPAVVSVKEAAEALALLSGLASEHARSFAVQQCPTTAAVVKGQADRMRQALARFIQQHDVPAQD